MRTHPWVVVRTSASPHLTVLACSATELGPFEATTYMEQYNTMLDVPEAEPLSGALSLRSDEAEGTMPEVESFRG